MSNKVEFKDWKTRAKTEKPAIIRLHFVRDEVIAA